MPERELYEVETQPVAAVLILKARRGAVPQVHDAPRTWVRRGRAKHLAAHPGYSPSCLSAARTRSAPVSGACCPFC
jgi:hypothetical protein